MNFVKNHALVQDRSNKKKINAERFGPLEGNKLGTIVLTILGGSSIPHISIMSHFNLMRVCSRDACVLSSLSAYTPCSRDIAV